MQTNKKLTYTENDAKTRILMAHSCVMISPFIAIPYNKHKNLITKLYIIHLVSKC